LNRRFSFGHAFATVQFQYLGFSAIVVHRSLFMANVRGANRYQSALNELYTFTATGIERRGSLRKNDAVDTLETLGRSIITFCRTGSEGDEEQSTFNSNITNG
jgi:hypothetical protein